MCEILNQFNSVKASIAKAYLYSLCLCYVEQDISKNISIGIMKFCTKGVVYEMRRS